MGKQFFRITLAFILIASFSMLHSCRTPGRPYGEMGEDTNITSKIKTRLVADGLLQGVAIDVDTFGGIATLTGAVKSEEQKERAEEIAKTISGVKKVNNLLVVRK